MIRRIHVVYRLQSAPEMRETIERVHEVHHRHCPVYRTIEGCVAVTTELDLHDVDSS